MNVKFGVASSADSWSSFPTVGDIMSADSLGRFAWKPNIAPYMNDPQVDLQTMQSSLITVLKKHGFQASAVPKCDSNYLLLKVFHEGGKETIRFSQPGDMKNNEDPLFSEKIARCDILSFDSNIDMRFQVLRRQGNEAPTHVVYAHNCGVEIKGSAAKPAVHMDSWRPQFVALFHQLHINVSDPNGCSSVVTVSHAFERTFKGRVTPKEKKKGWIADLVYGKELHLRVEGDNRGTIPHALLASHIAEVSSVVLSSVSDQVPVEVTNTAVAPVSTPKRKTVPQQYEQPLNQPPVRRPVSVSENHYRVENAKDYLDLIGQSRPSGRQPDAEEVGTNANTESRRATIPIVRHMIDEESKVPPPPKDDEGDEKEPDQEELSSPSSKKQSKSKKNKKQKKKDATDLSGLSLNKKDQPRVRFTGIVNGVLEERGMAFIRVVKKDKDKYNEVINELKRTGGKKEKEDVRVFLDRVETGGVGLYKGDEVEFSLFVNKKMIIGPAPGSVLLKNCQFHNKRVVETIERAIKSTTMFLMQWRRRPTMWTRMLRSKTLWDDIDNVNLVIDLILCLEGQVSSI